MLILGGVARVFDLGIFSEDPTQELKDEVVWVYKFVGKEPPEFTKSKDKETENTSWMLFNYKQNLKRLI